jgi:phospholipase C
MKLARKAATLTLIALAQASISGSSHGQDGLAKIRTIVVIYGENRSFDHMYGFFPGANGIANATDEQKTQLDHDGKPLPQLTIFGAGGKPDPRFERVPNAPFMINSPTIKMAPDQIAPSPIHAFFHNQEQINDGRNNMFAAMSSVGGWTMGYYDTSRLRLWQWAKEYTLADNFFMGAFGGSFLNHQWLVCACGNGPRNSLSPTISSWARSADPILIISGWSVRALRNIRTRPMVCARAWVRTASSPRSPARHPRPRVPCRSSAMGSADR